MSQSANQCASLFEELKDEQKALQDFKAFCKEMATLKAFKSLAEEMAAKKSRVALDDDFLCRRCVMPEPIVEPSKETIEVLKTYEFREAVADASLMVANDEDSKQVASYEVDRFIDYVHRTPIVKYGFQPVLTAPEIRD